MFRGPTSGRAPVSPHTRCPLGWGLETYLDPGDWFYRVLFARLASLIPTPILRVVVDGNLEAVLDEHLWIFREYGA